MNQQISRFRGEHVDGQLLSSSETLRSRLKRFSAQLNKMSMFQKFAVTMFVLWVPYGIMSALEHVYPNLANWGLSVIFGVLFLLSLALRWACK